MKLLRCNASSLVVRDVPGGKDTGRRILEGQTVQGYGESYDRAWVYVTRPNVAGWASAQYLVADRPPASSSGLNVVSQAAWGAKGQQGHPVAGARALVVVHHFASPDIPEGASMLIEQGAMKGVERTHEGKGWQDIGYNFVIFPSGRIYEGRGWGRTGAHADGANSKSVGIAFGINGEKHKLTLPAIASFRALINEGQRLGYVAGAYEIKGHRDVNTDTACPGDLVYAQLGVLR